MRPHARGTEQEATWQSMNNPDTRLLKAQHPHDSERRLRQRFIEAVVSDPDLNKAAISHFIRNAILN
jgi:hypothetical protein